MIVGYIGGWESTDTQSTPSGVFECRPMIESKRQLSSDLDNAAQGKG